MDLLTIMAIDRHSSDTLSRTFSTTSAELFKKSIEEFEKELPYTKYELTCNEIMEDYSKDIIDILEELEVTV